MTPEEICHHVLSEFEIEELDTANPVYKCYCSKEKVEKALISTGKEDLLDMAKDESTQVCCQFCDKLWKICLII